MSDTRRTPLVILLVTILALEAVFLAVVTVALTIELVGQQADFPVTALALVGLTALVVVWLVAMTVGVWRARAWTRGSILVYHFLQLAIGVGSLQGFVPRPDIASWIIIPSVLGIILALTPSVTEHLSRRG
ncbi:hypothetical protein [Chryseoglobus sp. 28M-23]|uniref:hypothetical protein n=1 Tax=Chryseoglobus sp. 28M-23 TaxID=2772253 RepID=UPI001747D698|nr:hypothetical protein [Chryseoglobus sp. 28M-23]QOD94291.1 hypothetical protein IE160_03440 [Chryseoglobus sp. 28M-23]